MNISLTAPERPSSIVKGPLCQSHHAPAFPHSLMPVPAAPDHHFIARAGQPVVLLDPLPLPVARGPELPQLPDDRSAVLYLPCPHPPEEFLPPEIVPGSSLLSEGLLDDILGRDAGVIGARHPERLESLHSFPADEDVLDRVVEDMPHREDPRDIRGRDDDRIRLPLRVHGDPHDGACP